MIRHHILLEAQGDAARRLLRIFRDPSQGRKDPISFITWLVATEKLDEEAPGEDTISRPADCIEADWTSKGRDLTVFVHDDLDDDPFVMLVESRTAPDPA